jgi:glycosyltransferase involved in cell wall biosynthesis
MKLLLIHQIFVTPEEGGGTRHYEMLKYLAQKQVDVTVFASDTDYLSGKKRDVKFSQKDNMKIYYLRTLSKVHASLLARALNFLTFSFMNFIKGLFLRNVDIIWSTSPPLFQAFSGLILAKIKRKKFLFEVRDLWLDFAVELDLLSKQSITYKIFKQIEKFVYKYSDKIIVNSPGFIPYIQRVVPDKEIEVFSNGVDMEAFEKLKANEVQKKRKEFGVEDKFVVLYTGNLGIANNIEVIIEVARMIQNTHPDIHFMLFGGGLKKEEFREKIQELKLKNITIFDSRPKKEMPLIISMADVCIATLKNIPLFSTVYPNKVFDYMACKKPTILAIEGEIRKVIENANGGIPVTPGNADEIKDAVLHYYENRKLIKSHGENAYQFVKKHFDRKVIVEKFHSFLLSWVKDENVLLH